MAERTVTELKPAHASRDGAGVAIQRVAGMQHAGMDPVLMIDELRSEYREDFAGGFPPHPHRGMQTLTYMKRGGILHEDSRGHRGEIRGGGVQWMSAGSGVIHSEMPTQDTSGLHGFQIWINLPRAEKMSAPRYRDIPATELQQLAGSGFVARAIAGHWSLAASGGERHDLAGALTELGSLASILDVTLQAGAVVTLDLPERENAMAYVYDGAVQQGETAVQPRHLMITAPGSGWTLRAGQAGAGVLVLRGRPLGEPVAHYGPFVMNSHDEIERAIRDYQSGQFV